MSDDQDGRRFGPDAGTDRAIRAGRCAGGVIGKPRRGALKNNAVEGRSARQMTRGPLTCCSSCQWLTSSRGDFAMREVGARSLCAKSPQSLHRTPGTISRRPVLANVINEANWKMSYQNGSSVALGETERIAECAHRAIDRCNGYPAPGLSYYPCGLVGLRGRRKRFVGWHL